MDFIFNQATTGTPELDELLGHIRNVDWAATCLGPMESWPRELSQLCHLVLLDPHPRALLLDREHALGFYNPAYARVIGDKHPSFLGHSVHEVWKDLAWDYISPIPRAQDHARPYTMDDVTFYLMVNELMQETILSWTVIPIAGIGGAYVSVEDVTEKRQADKRTQLLQKFTQEWTSAPDIPSLWQAVLKSFATDAQEFPFALLYTASERSGSVGSIDDPSDESFGTYQQLEGSIGDFADSNEVPTLLDIPSLTREYPQLLKALSARTPVVTTTDDNHFPEVWSRSSEKRGFGDPCKAAVICTMRSNRSNKVLGRLILGLHTRRRYDDNYEKFITEVSRAISDAITGILLAEEEAARELENAEKARRRDAEAYHAREKFQTMRDIIEKIDVGVFEYSPSGLLTQANNAYFELLGLPNHSEIKDAFFFLQNIVDEDVETAKEHWNNKLLRGIPASYETRRKRPGEFEHDDDENWYLAACVPVLDEDGDVLSVVGCITDISIQKRYQLKIRQRAEALERAEASQQRFKRFTDSAPVAISIKDKNYKTTYCNDRWFELLGVEKTREYSQIDMWQLIHDDDLHMIVKAWQDICVARRPVEIQYRLKRLWNETSHVWVTCAALPELDRDGEVESIIVTLTDISYLKWAESMQNLRLEEAMEAKRQQESFIDMTSHEIRNPLSAVVHCADSLAELLSEMTEIINIPREQVSHQYKCSTLDNLLEQATDAITTIISCSGHQRRIVDDILVASKIDAKLLEISPTRVHVTEIMRDVHKMFEYEAQKVGILLMTAADPSLESVSWIDLDFSRIKQILINLVGNAIKFTKNKEDRRSVSIVMGASKIRPSEDSLRVRFAGGMALESTVTLLEENDFYMWFTVEDTGRGMSPEENAKLFTRFAQGSPKTYGEYGGSGLGLFISRELARLQGGEIGVASDAGIGSTFAFYIKTSHSTPPVESEVNICQDLSFARRFSARKGSLGPISVLIVEDNLINQKVLRNQLTKHGYVVNVASNGIEALEFLQKTQYWRGSGTTNSTTTQQTSQHKLDVVLMDHYMPHMDGIECTQQIRAWQRDGTIDGHVPIISVSANARPEQRGAMLDAGMDETIVKPFRIPDLVPLIQRLAVWTKNDDTVVAAEQQQQQLARLPEVEMEIEMEKGPAAKPEFAVVFDTAFAAVKC